MGWDGLSMMLRRSFSSILSGTSIRVSSSTLRAQTAFSGSVVRVCWHQLLSPCCPNTSHHGVIEHSDGEGSEPPQSIQTALTLLKGNIGVPGPVQFAVCVYSQVPVILNYLNTCPANPNPNPFVEAISRPSEMNQRLRLTRQACLLHTEMLEMEQMMA